MDISRKDRVDYTGFIKGILYPHRILHYVDYTTGYKCKCIKCGLESYASGQYVTKGLIRCSRCKEASNYSFIMTDEIMESITDRLNQGMFTQDIIKYLKTINIIATTKDIRYIRNNRYNRVSTTSISVMNFQDIGDELKIPAKTAQRHYADAIRKLAKILNKSEMNELYEFN